MAIYFYVKLNYCLLDSYNSFLLYFGKQFVEVNYLINFFDLGDKLIAIGSFFVGLGTIGFCRRPPRKDDDGKLAAYLELQRLVEEQDKFVDEYEYVADKAKAHEEIRKEFYKEIAPHKLLHYDTLVDYQEIRLKSGYYDSELDRFESLVEDRGQKIEKLAEELNSDLNSDITLRKRSFLLIGVGISFLAVGFYTKFFKN